MSQPRIALCTWAFNQPELLRDNLLYHRRLGVEHVYLFVDDGGERASALAPNAPWVERIHRSSGAVPVVVHEEHCMAEARERARAAGHDWLLCLDADEFAAGIDGVGRRALLRGAGLAPGGTPERRADLRRLVREVPDDLDLVVLPMVEAIAPGPVVASPPREVVWFQSGRGLDRWIRAPRGDGSWRVGFMGHTFGKSLVRLSAEAVPAGPHRWRGPHGALRQDLRGILFHYFLTDAAGWHRKFRDLADGRPVYGPGHPPPPALKASWLDAAPRLDEGAAREYFTSQLVPARWRVWTAALRGRAVRSTLVRRVLAGIDAAGETVPQPGGEAVQPQPGA